MDDYRKLIGKIAVRYSGQPVTLSPQLFTDFRIQEVAGHDVDFRVVLFLGRIDPNDLTITFPEDTVVKVHVKHDVKAIDEESHRRRESGEQGRRTTRAVVCSRDCATYYRLPKGVEKGNLTAQVTEDAFLIIQSRKERSKVTGFEGKRLVPVRGYLNLYPCLSVNDLNFKVNGLMEAAYRLFQRMRDIEKEIQSWDLHRSFSGEPGTDDGNVSASFQDSSGRAFGLGSTSQSDAAGRDIGSSAQGEIAEGTKRRMTRSVKSAAEETGMKETGSTAQSEPVQDTNSKETGSSIESEAVEKDTGSTMESKAVEKDTGSTMESKAAERETGSTIESEAAERETGSTIESEAAERETGSTTESEAVLRDMGSSAQRDTAEEANRRMTRSAKSAAEEIGKNETGSTTQSKATEKDSDGTIQLEGTGEDSGFSAHDEVAKETTKRTTRSAKSAAEETSKKETGSVSLSEASVETKRTRSAQSTVTETTVEKETDSEASAKRVTRSALKTDDTDKKSADDLKSIVGKDCKETVPASESVEGGSQKTAGSDSKAEESGSKQSEVPRRVRSKERRKESSAVSELKEESKRRKSVI